jgi:mono/diheme cytochrome c family protein
MKNIVLILFYVGIVSACATSYNPLDDYREIKLASIMETPEIIPPDNLPYSPEQVTRGEYLVALLGCASCHTDGALTGTPNHQRHLAGSDTGIAYSNPLNDKNPGVVYPSNLTPDPDTGLGNVQDQAIIQQITIGINPQGGHTLPVMPWPSYSKLSSNDINAIVAYLRSLPTVTHKVPDNISPGQEAIAPFVHFGVYQSRQ